MKLLAQLKLPDGTSIPYPKGFAAANIGAVINNAVPLIFSFAGIALLLMLLSGGFGILTSSGDAKKLEGAKGRLTNAILGFFIIFVAYWLVQIVGIIFGINEIGNIFK